LGKSKKIIVGITVGDMNGIGPEIVLSVLSKNLLPENCVSVVYASYENLENTKRHLSIDCELRLIHSASEFKGSVINVLDIDALGAAIDYGKKDKAMGKLAYRCLAKAVKDLNEEKIDFLVTAPINKEAIQSKHFSFIGHTDYLNENVEGSPVMMMVSESLRVALLTEHLSLSKVTGSITKDLVESRTKSVHKTLQLDFNIHHPKIAMLSIDPHAGDNGVIGDTDNMVLAPCINFMKKNGIQVDGPFPADSFFGSMKYKEFDAVIAPYHDQGLIPFKTLSFGKGVNFTSGLKYVRTSPDHGTAYDIAGKGVAKDTSFLEAIKLALAVYTNRTKASTS
jgi:4-hydroxythreonine-4-phosphate dehydrogenase